MEIKKVGKISKGQDGAIYGSELFRFDSKGNCTVFDISSLNFEDVVELSPIAEFQLDRSDEVVPHSNAVCFGDEFYEQGDEFPLLYSNIYNNYAKTEDKMIGVCLVYRIQRDGNGFKTTLIQRIDVDFCEDAELWKASADGHGDRPYGNFVLDTENRSYWAFVMRNEALGTRYFRFDLPSVHDGECDALLNIKRVVLKKEDIRESFDCEYHRYIQGATLNEGKIYSTEGFWNDSVNHPAIRIIDIATHDEKYFDIMEYGLLDEPEFISFYKGKCLYSDYSGNLFEVRFEE